MKYTRAIFKNFIGFKIGLGLDTFEIDFSKCKNRMVLILAPNRSGKTTLLEGLTLFSTIYSAVRDENDFILPEKEGYRELHFEHEGSAYISKVHWRTKVGTRCFLSHFQNGQEIELNPSGNVGSYDEVLLARFGLSKEHNKLLFLGPGLRDVVSMTPSERKSNISKFTPDIQVYLDMYQDTSKYFAKLKGDIASVISELHRLGDSKENILLRLQNAKARYDSILEKVTYLKTVESKAQSIIDMLNIGGKPIVQSYTEMKKEYEKIGSNLITLNDTFKDICTKYDISSDKHQDEYTKMQQEVRDYYVTLQVKYDSGLTRERELITTRSTLQNIIQQKTKDLEDYEDKNNPDKFLIEQKSLSDELISSTRIIDSLLEEIPQLKDYINLFTKDDATKYMLFVDNVIDKTNALRSRYDESSIFEDYIAKKIDFKSFENTKIELEKEYNDTMEELQRYQEKIKGYDHLKVLSDLLVNIPSTCKEKSCPFIIKANEFTTIGKEHPIILQKIIDLTATSNALYEKISKFDEYENKARQLLKDMLQFQMYLNSNSEIITKFPDFNLFSDPCVFIQNVMIILPRARKFSEFSYAQERHAFLLQRLTELEKFISDAASFYTHVEQTRKDIDEINAKIIEYNDEIQHLYNDKSRILEELRVYEAKSGDLLSLLSIRSNILVGLKRYSDLKEIINRLHKHYVAGLAFEDNIERLRSKITFAKDELGQLEKELTDADYTMRTFDEYEKKRDILTEEYGLLETLRKAWSPTTGIPLIFIEGFMNRLLRDANKYLAEIWPEQDLIIDGFIIDEKNFYINVIQSDSLESHDASVCSGAERATLTTVLSLALLNQFPNVSSMYNIVKFDEIDNPLDYNTAKTFVGILNDLLDNINCQQSFLISHNDTFLSDSDVILLKDSEQWESRVLSGNFNIIYRN